MPSRFPGAHTFRLSPSRWPTIARVALVALLAMIAGIHVAARVT